MAKPLRMSRRLVEAIKLADDPAYKIAWQARVHPTMLSKLMTGAERAKPRDARVLRIAAILGIRPADAFAPEQEGK